MNYTIGQLTVQRRIAQLGLDLESDRLKRIDNIAADVRENHRATITMRIAHYEKRIAELDAKIGAAS